MAGLRHLIEAMINPYFLLLMAMLFCILKLQANIWRRALLSLWVLLGFLSTGFIPAYITRNLENTYPIVTQVNPDVKWIVVLSGGQSNHLDKPANMALLSVSVRRMLEGLRLSKALPQASIILSGGGYRHERAEAYQMAQVAELTGIEKKRIILEDQSINTADQASAFKKILHDESFYLVTSASHMPRSMYLCLREGLHPIAAPSDFTWYWDDEQWEKMLIPNAQNLMYVSIALHEYWGLAWAKLNH